MGRLCCIRHVLWRHDTFPRRPLAHLPVVSDVQHGKRNGWLENLPSMATANVQKLFLGLTANQSAIHLQATVSCTLPGRLLDGSTIWNICPMWRSKEEL
jgi:hypothetical protein